METIEKLHRKQPRLKVIALSDPFAGSMPKAAQQLGARASLQKPIQPDELMQIVSRVVMEEQT